MTREQQKQKKLEEELSFVQSIKDKIINGEEKNKFRTTSIWKNFRNMFYIIGEKILKNGKKKEIIGVDYISHKPLSKRFNLHHLLLDPAKYTELNENNFIPLNPQMHDDVVHYLYSLMCKDREVLNRLSEVIYKMGEINNWKDIKDFKKQV